MRNFRVVGNSLHFRGFSAGDKVDKIEYTAPGGRGGVLNTRTLTVTPRGKLEYDTGLNIGNGYSFTWEGEDAAGADINGTMGPVIIKTVTAPPLPPVVNTVKEPLNGVLVAITAAAGILALCLAIGLYFAVNKATTPATPVTITAPADPKAALDEQIVKELRTVADLLEKRKTAVAASASADATFNSLKAAAGL